MLKSRRETWGALIVLAIGVPFIAILGLWGYMSTTPPLHPNPQDVRSLTDSVMSNISYADTNSLAVRIAEAFAGQGKGSAGK